MFYHLTLINLPSEQLEKLDSNVESASWGFCSVGTPDHLCLFLSLAVCFTTGASLTCETLHILPRSTCIPLDHTLDLERHTAVYLPSCDPLGRKCGNPGLAHSLEERP